MKKEERSQSVLKAVRGLAQAEENLHQAQSQSQEADRSNTNIETKILLMPVPLDEELDSILCMVIVSC